MAHATFYVRQDADPNKRRQILVDSSEIHLVPSRGSATGYRGTVTDLITGKKITLRAASCGLPGCRCALAEVKKPKKARSRR